MRRRRKVAKGSRTAFLRRSAPSWARRHPGADGWQLLPPLPGVPVGQDVWIARTQPAANGYPDLHSGWAIFPTKAKAVRGCPEDVLAFGFDNSVVQRWTKHYSGNYRVHQLHGVRGRFAQ